VPNAKLNPELLQQFLRIGKPLKRLAVARQRCTALKRGVNKNAESGSAHFQLFSQDEVEYEKQHECGHDQHYRVESEHAERNSEIAFLDTEEHVWFIAAAVVVLLHLGS
jgi:hypothetical protein